MSVSVTQYLRLWEQQNVDEYLIDLEEINFILQMVNKPTGLHSINPAGRSPLEKFEKLRLLGCGYLVHFSALGAG